MFKRLIRLVQMFRETYLEWKEEKLDAFLALYPDEPGVPLNLTRYDKLLQRGATAEQAQQCSQDHQSYVMMLLFLKGQ